MTEEATLELHKELQGISATSKMTLEAVLGLRDRVARIEAYLFGESFPSAAPMVLKRAKRSKRRTSR